MEPSFSSKILLANRTLLADGELGSIATFFTEDYVVHLTDGDLEGGHGAVQKSISELRRSFPDLGVDVEVLVESAERVAWQRTLRGTHREKFKGFPASGREVVWRDMVTSQFRDGRIAEEWVLTDLAERLLLSRKRRS